MRVASKNDTSKIDTLLKLQEIISATKGSKVFGPDVISFVEVATDSRNVVKKTLFVPLEGENQDGHLYIPQAIENGASVVFLTKRYYTENKQAVAEMAKKHSKIAFITVSNTLKALQDIAEKYVAKFPKLVKVGITGSSGKTTTKEIAVAIISSKFNVICNQGNLNSETGLPLSVFKIREEHQVGIFEMGMNRENEIGEIVKVLKPLYGIVTNIGTAHIGNLGSRDNIAAEKAKVFTFCKDKGYGIIPYDDDYRKYLASNVHGHVVFYGNDAPESTVRFVRDKGLEGTEFSIAGQHGTVPLPGKYNYKNAQAAIALAQVLGFSASEIIAGMKNVKPLFGRSQVLKGTYTVIQDCYNANPDSMEKALELAGSLEFDGRKAYVLGDMLELGKDSKKAHEKIGKLALESAPHTIIFIGKEMKAAYDKVKGLKSLGKIKAYHIAGKDDADLEKCAKTLRKNLGKKGLILVKGSRGMGLERLAPMLEDSKEK